MPAPSPSPAEPTLPSLWRRFTSPLSAGIVLVLFWGVLQMSLREKSSTMDEPLHAAAGYTYWKLNDYRVQPENGNLPQRVFGLAYQGDQFAFPSLESPLWKDASAVRLAFDWFNHSGHDPAAMLLRGRAISGLFAVALGAVIWLWARRLFGPVGGMLSLLLYVLNPSILANGALMTSDTASALFFLLATWRAWAVVERCSVRNVLFSALATGLLFVTKMSAILIVPIVGVLVGYRLWQKQPLSVAGVGEVSRRGAQAAVFGVVALCHALVAIGIVWGSYGFRYSAFAPEHAKPGHFISPWEWMLDQPDHIALLNRLQLDTPTLERASQILNRQGADKNGWSYAAIDALALIRETVLSPEQARALDVLRAEPSPQPVVRLLEFARGHRLLPEAYLYGYAHVWKLSQRRTAFFNGEVRDTGWRTFFPYTFLVKTPLALFALIGLAVAGVTLRRRADGTPPGSALGAATLPLWTLMVVYWVPAIFSHLNIGHRHILPVYPPLFILCGAAGLWLVRAINKDAASEDGDITPQRTARFASVAVSGILVVLAAESVAHFPNYLTYFNGLIRPSRAYEHLVDSSLDWGQDLPDLARYIEERKPAGPHYLAYFGADSPRSYGVRAHLIHGFTPFAKQHSPPFQLLPDAAPNRHDPAVAAFLAQEPDYDPETIFGVSNGPVKAAVMPMNRTPQNTITDLSVSAARRLSSSESPWKSGTVWNSAGSM